MSTNLVIWLIIVTNIIIGLARKKINAKSCFIQELYLIFHIITALLVKINISQGSISVWSQAQLQKLMSYDNEGTLSM